MQKFYPVFLSKFKKTSLSFLFVLLSYQSFSQSMVFQNPTLVSGSSGQDGAIYRFSNVTVNTDALVTINKRSSTLVTLDSVDMIGTGYYNAFQPMVTYNKGNAKGPDLSWWMEFNISFVVSGTNIPVMQDSVFATGLDIDGDDGALQEQLTTFGAATYTLNSPTSLTQKTVTDTLGASGKIGVPASGMQLTGSTANLTGIDTSAKNAMVTFKYIKVSSITIRYGAQESTAATTSVANRQNSIWFKGFTYNTAAIHTLPISLLSFTAQLNNNTDKVNLDWITSAEINASNFVVQRSEDGSNYDDEAIVFTQEGNSSLERKYYYNDNLKSAHAGLIYYRLKMVDMDGQFSYSAIDLIELSNQNQLARLLVFPNPAQTELHITIPDSWQGKSITYHIYDVRGNLVKQKITNNAGQTELLSVADLPDGIFVLKAGNGNQTLVQRIIKLNR